MAMVKKSITVTDQQEQWIQAQLATGNYASDSELLRDLIRKEQMRTAEIEAIRMKLIEAEQSGFSDRSPNEILASVKEEALRNGKL
ncbi:type II toxin-antitoxin system ParD family antitoxin [Catenovulum sp. SX2]|uniref:type II toxin-antitoxin system ParD family antitoxin n=1 Tax=Catenovulum sp. SX2 TaxID=3398614 RepID=UPI003F835D77